MVTLARREKVRAKWDIVHVIGAKVPLMLADDVWVGQCPFHKGDGFTVSHRLQAYHCFGCHKGGDLIRFVQDYEGMPYEAAVALLESSCGRLTRARGSTTD